MEAYSPGADGSHLRTMRRASLRIEPTLRKVYRRDRKKWEDSFEPNLISGLFNYKKRSKEKEKKIPLFFHVSLGQIFCFLQHKAS